MKANMLAAGSGWLACQRTGETVAVAVRLRVRRWFANNTEPPFDRRHLRYQDTYGVKVPVASEAESDIAASAHVAAFEAARYPVLESFVLNKQRDEFTDDLTALDPSSDLRP